MSEGEHILELERAPSGLKVRQSPLHLDARSRSALGFLAHARGARATLPERLVATASTLALLEAARPRALARTAPLPASFGQAFALAGLRLSLAPAGHILGSASLRCEKDGEALVYAGDLGGTGDRAPATAEPREPIRCDTLVLRATYGHPRLVFPPRAGVLAALSAWIDRTQAEGLVPVVLAARLGGAQEAVRHLAAEGRRLRLHPAVHKACEAYVRLGVALGPFAELSGAPRPDEVVLLPAGPRRDKRPPAFPHRTLLLTGRALDPDLATREQVDAALPLSDHAGFDQLVETALAAGALRVLTVHGFAEELALALRERGLPARALDHEAQLRLPGL